jgi:type VI secretion system protein ImpE
MNASELYSAGKLQDAIKAQTDAVKAAPADPAKRLFLFELQVFAGDLDRAKRQIDAVKYDDPGTDAAVAVYRKLLEAETARRKLFQDGVAPQAFGPVADQVKLRIEAVQRLREKNHAEAAAALGRAAEATRAFKGQLNEKPFDGLRDADDLFGGALEVMAHGAYYWVALEDVLAVAANAPRYPRDLIWLPARLTLRDGQEGEVYLPALYPGSHEAADDALKLGRATDWKNETGGPVLGVGCKTFLAGEDPITLLEFRQLVCE